MPPNKQKLNTVQRLKVHAQPLCPKYIAAILSNLQKLHGALGYTLPECSTAGACRLDEQRLPPPLGP